MKMRNAIMQGQYEVVKQALDNGTLNPDFTFKESYGCTGIMCAAMYSRIAIIDLLLEYGADINKTNDNGWTAFMFAAVHSTLSLAALADRGADIHIKTPRGWTALTIAVNQGKDSSVNYLLSRGDMPIDGVDNMGNTALAHAAWHGHNSIAKSLLVSRAKVDIC